MHVVAYAKRLTNDPEARTISQQLEAIRSWCRDQRHYIVAEFSDQMGQGAGYGWQRVVTRLEDGVADAVVVDALDNLPASAGDAPFQVLATR